jgi:catechol 2,3-dioxygenase-like lactoylglutathione lyase family enzyme
MKRTIGAVLSVASISLGAAQPVRGADEVFGARPQQVLYVGLEAADVGRSAKFYTDIIGLKPVVRPGANSAGQPSAPQYATLSFSGQMEDTGLIIRQRNGPALASNPIVGLKVSDLQAIVARAKAAGVTVLSEPHPAPRAASLIISVLKDPDGNMVELLQGR